MNYNYFRFIFLFSGILIFSCSKNYLDKPVLGQLDEESLANKKGVEGLLIGAYSLLDGYGSSKSNRYGASAGSNYIYGSISGTEGHKGSIETDQYEIEVFARFTFTPTDPLLASKWGVVYDGVQRSNDVLRIMKKAKDISVEDQVIIAAEARFLRAFYHFEAKKMWNKVPYVDESITYPERNYHISNEKDIWPDIENDLMYASDNLPEMQREIGRANKFTAMALLAKAYMFEGISKYPMAKSILDSIINSGRYKLTDNYSDNFDAAKKNNRETVFAAQSSVNDGGDGNNGNPGDVLNFPADDITGSSCCGFFQPTQYLVNHFKTIVESGMPDFDGFDEDIKSDEGLESSDDFTAYQGSLDPRLDWTVGRRGIPYLDWGNHPGNGWIRDQHRYGPYSPIKSSYYKSQLNEFTDVVWSNFTAININLIRFADILLWAAEVEVEIGSLGLAETYVNIVRSRAANPAGWVHTYIDANNPNAGFTNIPAANYSVQPYPDGYFSKKGLEFSRNAVRLERMVEFGMEGHRFFDLVRWGIADTEITRYLERERILRTYLIGVVFKKDCNEYFPIPQTQIDLSAGQDGIAKMKQNPGY